MAMGQFAYANNSNRFMGCAPLVDLFGEHFIQTYSAIKETEYREYFDVISPWERRFLLLHV